MKNYMLTTINERKTFNPDYFETFDGFNGEAKKALKR